MPRKWCRLCGSEGVANAELGPEKGIGSAEYTESRESAGLRAHAPPSGGGPSHTRGPLRPDPGGARWLRHAPSGGDPLLAGLAADPRPAAAAPAMPLRGGGLGAAGLGGDPRHEGGVQRRGCGWGAPSPGSPDTPIPFLQVRGAPAIALVGCLSLAVELQAGAGGPGLAALVAFVRDSLSFLVTARPTAVNMARAARDLADAAAQEAEREGATEEAVRER